MLIVDAHLDLSYNALRGRDVLQAARMQQADEEGIPTVGLPDLRRGGVGLVCATVFCMPSLHGKPGYRTAEDAHAQGQQHLAWYRRQVENGTMRLVTSKADLSQIQQDSTAQHAVLLMEGADPLRNAADVAAWHSAGLRMVGLAWKRTRLAGGTGEPGPLTPEGIGLVKALDQFGIIHDISHLAEQSFWQLLELSGGPVAASHSNCRSIVPTDRQLSDGMIRAIVERGGIIGINFFDRFLIPPDQHGKRRATLDDVVAHMKHICDLAGSAGQAGIGTDMDGGLGRNEIPIEIQTSADLPRLAEALTAGGFSDGDITGIMGGNWLRFFGNHLG